MILHFLMLAAAFSVALFCGSTIAAAETLLLEVPVRYLVVPPMEAGEKRVSKGDTVFTFPLRWEQAAILSKDVEARADAQADLIKKGQAIVRTRLKFDSPEFSRARSFCVPRKAAPVDDRLAGALLGSLGMKLVRSGTDGQFCLIDRDNDGQLDHSVLVNDGSPAARMPVQMAPISYELAVNVPVSEGDSLRILYRDKYRFELEIVQQDEVRHFDSFSVNTSAGRREYLRQARSVKTPDGSFAITVPGVELSAASYDKASKSAAVRWPATKNATVMPVPEDVRFRVRYGY